MWGLKILARFLLRQNFGGGKSASAALQSETTSRHDGSRTAKEVRHPAAVIAITYLLTTSSRSKISNDPQNTHWANNTERFGHKILEKQGWKTGDTLGARDAAHEAHYTQASQSHIRVFLKDDNLGLGAKRGSERAENFGLAGLESILGRLNGREEEVKKEEARREEIEKRAYVYRKFGSMNFVSGGFLVGDKLVPRAEVKLESLEPKIKEEPDSDNESRKKRKRDAADASEEGPSELKLKRKKKSMDLREEADKQDKKTKKDKKEKKEKKEKKDKSSKKIKKEKASSDPEPMSDDAPTPASDPEPLTDKARRKAEKKARKEEKKLKKALKRAAKEAKKSKDSADDSSSESDDDDTPSSSVPATGTSTPSFVPRGVQTARHRHIMMKKRASMDPQALKEVREDARIDGRVRTNVSIQIFMIKTPVA
jgi:Pin2-interacting protein X1